jgi:hypothetical protein
MTTHLIIPDPHAHPDHSNERADYLGKLILDIRPDVVINMGDMFDMPSLSGYDKGKASFHGRNYKKDIAAGLDFDERMWGPIRRAKKRRPRAVFIEGNHEERQRRMLEYSPEFDGAVSFNDFDLDRNYQDIVRYTGGTPGSIEIDGIIYAHYAISGVMGRPISGEHPAYSLLTKQFQSVTVGHLHVLDYCTRTDMLGKRMHGLISGVYMDYDADWAGHEICKMWNRGVVIKKNVENGDYDLEWVSLARLKKEYGGE